MKKLSNTALIMALMLTSQCSAMEPPHKKLRTSYSPEEAEIRHLAETHDIPTLQVFIRPLMATEQQLAYQIEETEEFLQNQIPSSELRERHPLIAPAKTILRNIRKQLNIYEQAVNLRKPKVEYEAWRNKVKSKGKHIGYFTNRQITGKDPAAHSYLSTFKGMAHTLPEKIADYSDELELKKGDLLLAQVTNDPEEIIDAFEAEIKLIQGCIDECKMHARIVLDSLEFEKEPDELLKKKFEELLGIKSNKAQQIVYISPQFY